MRSVPLIRCLPNVAVVVDFHWFTDCHLDAIFNMNMSQSSASIFNHCWQERCSSDYRRFFLNPVQHDILPHRQSQLSDLTIRLHVTTSLKSTSQKRWLYHQIFKWSSWPVQFTQCQSRDQSFFVLIGLCLVAEATVKVGHKYVNVHRHQLLISSEINNVWSMTVTVLQHKS